MSLQQGFIPDYKTALKIAESIWLPIYGDRIYNQEPFNTTLLNDSIWIVAGTLPEKSVEGTVYLKIRKKDAKITFVTHYK